MIDPAYFRLHSIAETDRRFHALARFERVDVGTPAFLIWAPTHVPAERLHHRGRVAVALDVAAVWHDGAPDLWLEGKPYVFLRAEDVPAWLEARRAGRDVWFTYDGASLHSLLDASVDVDGLLVIDVERVVG